MRTARPVKGRSYALVTRKTHAKVGAGSGKREAGSGKREAGSGKRKRKRVVLPRPLLLPSSLFLFPLPLPSSLFPPYLHTEAFLAQLVSWYRSVNALPVSFSEALSWVFLYEATPAQ